MELDFYKLHLNSHDFILVNAFRQPLPEAELLPRLSAHMCNRHSGVGARGVIFLHPGDEHQARVVYYDGSGAEEDLGGGALLCAARYAFDFGLAVRGTTVVENGEHALDVQCIDGVHFRHCLEEPKTAEGRIIADDPDVDLSVRVRVAGRSLSCTPIRLGHIVAAIYADKEQLSAAVPIEGLDEEIDIGGEPYRVAGYQVLSRDELKLFFRSSEEGDALEGAAAAATAAVLGGFCDRDVVIHHRGGKFLYEWQSPSNRIFMTGSPQYSFTGVYELDDELLRDQY